MKMFKIKIANKIKLKIKTQFDTNNKIVYVITKRRKNKNKMSNLLFNVKLENDENNIF